MLPTKFGICWRISGRKCKLIGTDDKKKDEAIKRKKIETKKEKQREINNVAEKVPIIISCSVGGVRLLLVKELFAVELKKKSKVQIPEIKQSRELSKWQLDFS